MRLTPLLEIIKPVYPEPMTMKKNDDASILLGIHTSKLIAYRQKQDIKKETASSTLINLLEEIFRD